MAATLHLIRAGLGIELRGGRFEISLDGKSAGSIDWHQKVELTLEPGPHTLLLRAGRHTSRGQSFDATDGQAISFRCHGAMLWPRYVASIFKPDLAISLKRVQ